jgi:hypothetical protein
MKNVSSILMSVVFVLSTLALIVLFGCQSIQNRITPADVPQSAVQYAYPDEPKDANGFVKIPKRKGWLWNSKADLVDVMFNVDLNHIKLQADFEYQMTKDKSVYSKISSQGELALKEANQDQASVFGQNGLLAMGLGLISGGSLIGTFVNQYKNRTMYSDDEVKVVKNETQNDSLKINYTEAEYKLGIAEAKTEALNTLKLSMYTEDEVKEFKDKINSLEIEKAALTAKLEIAQTTSKTEITTTTETQPTV